MHRLYIGNENRSSWSLRPRAPMTEADAFFTPVVLRLPTDGLELTGAAAQRGAR